MKKKLQAGKCNVSTIYCFALYYYASMQLVEADEQTLYHTLVTDCSWVKHCVHNGNRENPLFTP